MAEELNLDGQNQEQKYFPHRIVKHERFNDGTVESFTFDANGRVVNIEVEPEIIEAVMEKADNCIDGWQVEKEQMEKEAALKARAYATEKARLEEEIDTVTSEKGKAEEKAGLEKERANKAEERASELKEQLESLKAELEKMGELIADKFSTAGEEIKEGFIESLKEFTIGKVYVVGSMVKGSDGKGYISKDFFRSTEEHDPVLDTDNIFWKAL